MLLYAVRLPPVAICKSLKILYSLTIISIIHSNDYPHNQLNFKKDVQERKRKFTYVNNFHRMGHLLDVQRGMDTLFWLYEIYLKISIPRTF